MTTTVTYENRYTLSSWSGRWWECVCYHLPQDQLI